MLSPQGAGFDRSRHAARLLLFVRNLILLMKPLSQAACAQSVSCTSQRDWARSQNDFLIPFYYFHLFPSIFTASLHAYWIAISGHSLLFKLALDLSQRLACELARISPVSPCFSTSRFLQHPTSSHLFNLSILSILLNFPSFQSFLMPHTAHTARARTVLFAVAALHHGLYHFFSKCLGTLLVNGDSHHGI